jgi:hypothetical protein
VLIALKGMLTRRIAHLVCGAKSTYEVPGKTTVSKFVIHILNNNYIDGRMEAIYVIQERDFI